MSWRRLSRAMHLSLLSGARAAVVCFVVCCDGPRDLSVQAFRFPLRFESCTLEFPRCEADTPCDVDVNLRLFLLGIAHI